MSASKKTRPLKCRIYRKIRYIIRLLTRYPLELVGALLFCGVFRLLSLDKASAVGGFLGRTIGPRLKISWVARYNLMKAFPEKTPQEIDKIVVEMWDHVVRVFVEYPHLRTLTVHSEERVEFVNFERCEQLRDDGKAGIVFSAHVGNWETSSIMGRKLGIPFHRIYRPANNPYVEWMFRFFRQKTPGELVPKGLGGFRQVVSIMRKGGHFALMIDQKMNEGIEVDFFGYPAMTTPSLANLVLKYDYPALPLYCKRLKGAYFQVIADDFLTIEKTGDAKQDTFLFMQKANKMIENWIRETPAQWFWVHKRWPDSKTGWKKLYKQRKLWKKGEKPEEIFQNAIKNRIERA